jgi:hypothetical protein
MNFLVGLSIIIGLVCLLFGALTRLPQRSRLGGFSPVRGGRRGHAPMPSFGHWDAPIPRPQSHLYQDNLKKNQGGWRWG